MCVCVVLCVSVHWESSGVECPPLGLFVSFLFVYFFWVNPFVWVDLFISSYTPVYIGRVCLFVFFCVFLLC